MSRLATLVIVVLFLFSNGCVAVSRRVEYSDVERLKIRFEGVAAAKAFWSSFHRLKPYHSDMNWIVSPLLLVRVEWVLHETEFYNAQVRKADVDRDGVITEAEAELLLSPQD